MAKAASGLVEVAQSSGSGASSSTGKAEKEAGGHLMKTEDASLKRFRNRCANSMWVVGAILSRDGLQHLAR
eukprot:6513070-Lingulodinium_polyedra.AAC.1